jgi:hypothetical protein
VGRAASGGPRARWEQALRARSAGRAGLRGERELGQGEGGAWRWATGGLRARLLGGGEEGLGLFLFLSYFLIFYSFLFSYLLFFPIISTMSNRIPY